MAIADNVKIIKGKFVLIDLNFQTNNTNSVIGINTVCIHTFVLFRKNAQIRAAIQRSFVFFVLEYKKIAVP